MTIFVNYLSNETLLRYEKDNFYIYDITFDAAKLNSTKSTRYA